MIDLILFTSSASLRFNLVAVGLLICFLSSYNLFNIGEIMLSLNSTIFICSAGSIHSSLFCSQLIHADTTKTPAGINVIPPCTPRCSLIHFLVIRSFATSLFSPTLPDTSSILHIHNGINPQADNSGVVDHHFHKLIFL
jgi:hypothetical protein